MYIREYSTKMVGLKNCIFGVKSLGSPIPKNGLGWILMDYNIMVNLCYRLCPQKKKTFAGDLVGGIAYLPL